MFRHAWLALSLVFVGCSGDTTKDTTDVGDDDDDDDDTDTTPGDSQGGGGGGGLEEIAAVGFEMDGVLLSDGNWSSWVYGAYEIPPGFYLTFTTAEYFSATAAQQEEESCFAFVPWAPGPLDAANNIPAVGNPTLNWSWEGALTIEDDFSDCPDRMDAAMWAELRDGMSGTDFGMGLSTMNQTFLDKWGISDYPQYVADWEEFGLVEYIAINDREGDFIARNWNAAFLYQWDETTGEPVADGNGYLQSIPVSTTPAGSALPQGYLRSNAFWYADFCSFLDNNGYQASAEESCIDLGNL